MQHEPPASDLESTARSDLHQAMMTAFCDVLHASRLSPMLVMELVAESVGLIYKEVADAHRGDTACPCGWRPSPEADVEILQAALSMSAAPEPATDLRTIQVAGRA